jgi:hypothetical protein
MVTFSRSLVLLAGVFALAAAAATAGVIDGRANRQPAIAPTSTLQAFNDVCVAPGSHHDILDKARRLGWRALRGDAVPALLRGNGMVSLQEVRQGEIDGAPVLLSIGELGGTSFCRIYFRPVDTAVLSKRLQAQTVLNAPLGQPDFHGEQTSPEGREAVGWHRSVGAQWRALHYSFDADARGPDAAWQEIEITRAI